MSFVSGHNLRKTLVAGAVAVVVLALLVSHAFNYYQNSNWWVAHTLEVNEALEQVLSSVKDAETGQRGFLITGEESYLDPYHQAIQGVQSEVDRLRRLTADNPVQQEHLLKVEAGIERKVAELEHTITLRRQEGYEAARTVVLEGHGKAEMDALREIVQVMQVEEDRLLQKRMSSSQVGSIGFYVVLLLLVVGWSAVFILGWDYHRFRDRSEEDLQLLNEELAASVRQLEELRNVVPICSYCKAVRRDKDYWQRLEAYFVDKADVWFSHSICPDCEAKRTSKREGAT